MNRTLRLLWAAIGLVAALALACGGSDASKELTPEDLLAAMLSPDDVQELFSQPERWWPLPPEFNVGFDPAPGAKSGERFWVTRSYQEVGKRANGRVETSLLLFDDEASATMGFDTVAEISDKDGETVDGPSVGDEWRYFTRSAEDNPYETTLRFRVGPIVGRMTVFSDRNYAEPQTLAGYFAPVAERIERLLDGSLRAAPLPQQIAELMPSGTAAKTAGPVFGSAVTPVESWALIDAAGDPEAVRERLRDLGATELGLRRYGVQADPDQIIEVVLFPMADSEAAASWVQEFIDALLSDETMDAGNTGDLSGFTSYDGSTYELQFAKGRVVGDVVCFAPFGETSSACEKPVRELAERWYAELPES